MTLNLTGRARELLERERTGRGVGLAAAAVEALALELGALVTDLEARAAARAAAVKRASSAPSGVAFPARDHETRTRVENPQRVGLLFTPDEAIALKTAADRAKVSMSQLVSEAVVRHYGGGEAEPDA